MSASHTPGPLEIRPSLTGSGRSFAITSNGVRVALFENKADAALFVAAPELLEALKELEGIQTGPPPDRYYREDWRQVMRKVSAAIAKAEGGQP